MTTQHQQLKLLREARRVGEAAHMLDLAEAAGVLRRAGWTSERIALLLRLPVQGGVTHEDRLAELFAVDTFLGQRDDALRIAARMGDADWHALVEPARWLHHGTVVWDDVEAFVRAHFERTGAWPKLDPLRRRFGYAPTHRLPGEQEGQEQLGGVA